MNISLSRIISLLFLTVAIAVMVSCKSKRVGQPTLKEGVPVEISESILLSEVADTIKLGRMREGEKILKELLIINNGDVPFVISDIDSGCGCLLFEYNRQPIEPKGEKKITMFFHSRGFYGEVIKTARLRTSLSDKPLRIVVDAKVE